MAAGEIYTPDEWQAHLQRQEREIRSLDWLPEAFPLVCKFLESQSKKAFHDQASPGGVAWVGLAHTRARGTTGHVLRDTGELMASVTGSSAGNIRRLDGSAIVFGTNNIKGFHNRGGMIQRRSSRFLTIPATKEALYAGSMRNFPSPLKVYWNEAKGKGIAYERVKIKAKARSHGGGGGGRTRTKRRGKSRWRRLVERARRFGNSLLGRLKEAKKKKAKAKKAKKKKPTSRIVVHYYLRAFVIVPQRQFLEVTGATKEKVGKIITATILKRIGFKGR